MERHIAFSGDAPSWETIQKHAAALGVPIALKMIDGLPAFPDELPDAGWRELRFSSAAGMMSLRLQPGQMSVVVWGNADESLRSDWETVAKACAQAAGGSVSPDAGASCGK
ncbi:MAG: hypothetical protein K8T89_12880 [Planctomycetes bacterium]|nr:hypothetical protein [Planctomycetota bacterium]